MNQKEFETDIVNVCLEHFDDDDFFSIQDAVNENLNVTITSQKAKEIFKILDFLIICDVIKWGFSDTEVRSNIYDFVEKNKEDVLKIIS